MTAWNNKVSRLLGHAFSGPFFGEEFRIEPRDTQAHGFAGAWSDTYVTADPDTGMEIMSSQPNIGVRLSDFRHPPRLRDTVYRFWGTRAATPYLVRAIEPDGEGGAVLVLEKVKE